MAWHGATFADDSNKPFSVTKLVVGEELQVQTQ